MRLPGAGSGRPVCKEIRDFQNADNGADSRHASRQRLNDDLIHHVSVTGPSPSGVLQAGGSRCRLHSNQLDLYD